MARSIVDEVADRLRLDADGRASAPGDGAAERLRARAGDWRLFRTSPDLALMVRDAFPQLGGEERPRAVLAGDLSRISAADVAVFLSQGHFDGVLVTRSAGVERTLSFRAGKLCWATSTAPSERLGDVAERHGLIPRAALEKVVRDRLDLDPRSRKLGQHIVDAGLMTFHDLWRAIQLQVSEIFFSLLIAPGGTFVFIDAPEDPSLNANLALDTQGLLLEGARRIDEMHHFRKRIPSGEVVPRPTGRALPEGAGEKERRVIAEIDGRRSVIDLGMRCALGEFEATKVVHHLVEAGCVQVDAAPRERTPTPGAMDAAILVAKYNTLLADIHQALADSGLDAPFRISMDAFLLGEQKQFPLLAELSLGGDGTLDDDRLLAHVADRPGPAGAEALRPMLESVSSFALFQAREILDDDTGNALAAKARALIPSQ